VLILGHSFEGFMVVRDNDKVAFIGQPGEGGRKPVTVLGHVIRFGVGAVLSTALMGGGALALVRAAQKRAERQGRW
jgi:hypothetical protein